MRGSGDEQEIRRCDNCVFFQTVDTEGTATRTKSTRTYCRRRLHSGSMGSKPEMKMNMRAGTMQPTGARKEQVASFFPQTMPDWWCGDYEHGAPSHEVRPSGEHEA